ncbi:ABC transporter substrate binding protein [Thiotrichales bacterium HSG1]|nr:ABC transporter substrate binding protein [Thiotrichales bacterium HSG1]
MYKYLPLLIVLIYPFNCYAKDVDKQILLINSYHQSLGWNEEIYQAVKDVFDSANIKYQLHVENMDTKRVKYNENYQQRLSEIYDYKYNQDGKIHFDLIMLADNNAFDFMNKYHGKLFPTVPVVFFGVAFNKGLKVTNPYFTGVEEIFDAPATVEVALKLNPNLKEIFVINDFLPSGIAWAKMIKDDLQTKGYDKKFKISFAGDWNMSELQEYIDNLPENSMGIIGLYFRDRDGQFFTVKESAKLMSQGHSTPIYTLLNLYLDKQGSVGGNVISGYYQGETAAKLAIRIFNGDKVKDIAIVREGANRYIYNYQGLTRLGLSVTKLPKNSIILNQPYSFYQEHKTFVWIVIIFITILLIVNIFLLKNIAKRKRVQQKLKQLSNELKIKAEEADAANKAKSIFLAHMSHELRTPLNAILGFSQIISDSKSLSKTDRDNINIITNSGEHLLTLINQVLDLSKIEAGRTTINNNNFDLHQLLDDLEIMFSLKIKEKNLKFICERQSLLPQYVNADDVKLRQILINLLNNAVKFTKKGKVEIYVSHNEKHKTLDFIVRDTGHGIAKNELDNLFKAFIQTSSGKKQHEGTGLGLSISRKFIRLMGGDVTANSILGEGTTFEFYIKYKIPNTNKVLQPEAPKKVIALAANQMEYRILIVDDKWSNRQLMVSLLKPLGFMVKEAENGKKAVEIFNQWQPHLIWMDMRMPIMDGYNATMEIRKHVKGQGVAIIALTANALDEGRANIEDAGCDDYLQKPFNNACIFEIMHRHIGVKYIYLDDSSANTEIDHTEEFTPHTLSQLPNELLEQLLQAATMLDMEETQALIEQVAKQSKFLADKLLQLVGEFEYDELQSLIKQAQTL